MKKKLNLDVDKLMNHPTKKKRTESVKLTSQKQMNFQQMYYQAKKAFNKHHHHDPQKSVYYHSQNNSVTLFSESLKASRKTPQNSSRNHHHQTTYEKLNKSLQTKSHSIQQKQQCKRSSSSEFKIMPNPRKSQTNIKKTRNVKNAQQKLTATTQSQNQFQVKQTFKKQWTLHLQQLNHSNHEHLRGTQCFLNIQQIFQILKGLHYIRKTQDQKYLVKIWKQLDGQTYGGIPSNNLYQFLTYINHSHNSYYPQNKKYNQKVIKIDANLKIVASEAAKLQIYQTYLALRVNKILYGSNQQNGNQHQKFTLKTNNIKIIQEEEQPNQKKKIIMLPKKTPFHKKSPIMQPYDNGERVVRVSSRQQKVQAAKQIEQTLQKDRSQQTICYSQFSQTRQSGKYLTSNSSEGSIQGPQSIEEIVIKKPLFSVDVNIGEGVSEKIVVYEGQTARQVSKRLVQKYKIDDQMRNQFQQLLGVHIRNLLFRIQQVSQEFFSDRQE